MAGRISNDMVKAFNGEGDVVAWVTKVKLVAKLKKVDNVADFLPLFLEGNALALYLELSESEQASALQIEAKLLEAFADGPFVAFKKLMQKKWVGEPVDVYANDIRRLARLSGFVGVNLQRVVTLIFINCFPNSVSAELQQVDSVLILEMTTILDRARILTANKTDAVGADNKTDAVVAAVTASQYNQYSGAKSDQSQRAFRGRCYRCGEPHMQRNCKIKKVVTCYRCGKEGHIAPQCDQGNDNRVAAAPAATLQVE